MALHSQDSFASIQLFTNNWPQGLALLNVLVTKRANIQNLLPNMNELLNETAASEISDLCATG